MEVHQFITDPKNFGLQQKLQWFYLASCNLVTSMHLIASVFISASVDFRCQIPGLDNDTYSVQGEEHNSAILSYIPLTSEGKYNSCYILEEESTNYTTTRKCDSFVYDRSQFSETTTSQFNLVCNDVGLSTFTSVIYMAGLFAGSLIFGTVSDILGRKWTVYIGLCLQGGIAVAVMFSPSLTVFTILRFLLGAVTIGGLIAQFTLMVEICPQNMRTVAAICQTMMWCAGVILLSGLAFGLRHWKYLQMCIACFSGPYILLYWWLVEESPSWLLAKGRKDHAVAILKKIKKRNKLDVDIDSLEFSEPEKTDSDSTCASFTATCSSIFKSKTLLWNIILNSFAWFVASMGYYGLALNVGNLVGDLYINNLISGLVEIPAYLLLLTTNRLGRKYVYIFLMSIGGVALVVSAFLIVFVGNVELNWVIVTVNMIGKFAVSAGFELIYFWSVEMYPTSQRNFMLGLNSAIARVGSMVSPAIADIPKFTNIRFAKGFAPLIFGVLMIVTAASAFLLPETYRLAVPESVEEANLYTFKYKGRPSRTADNEDIKLESKEL